MVSDTAAIAWSKISKIGAQLSDVIGSAILPVQNGGTGADLSATGGAGKYLQQSSAGAAVTVGTIAATDLPAGIDAAKIADGTVSNAEYQYINSLRSNAQDQLDAKMPAIFTRRQWWMHMFPGNLAPIGVALPAIAIAGNMTDGSSTDYQGTTWTLGAAATGSTIGPRINGTIPILRWSNDPAYRCRMKTGPDVTSIRLNYGLFTATTMNADGGTATCAIFRFSTVAGDTNWQAITNDGSATGTITDTGIAVAASTEYELAIIPSGDGTTAKFYINGALVATHTTKMPAAGSLFWPIWCLTTQAVVVRAITLFWACGEHD
jgi:hypothetical protein